MEDRNLIVAVCSRPVLYNTTMVSYRDRNKKERAWVDVAEDTGFPVDVCRRKWKSLRDRCMRHKKSEQEGKKSGSAAGTVTRWKFAGVLSFLDPFVTPRETSSNLPRGAEETSPALSQRTLMLLLLLSLPLALHVYLSLRLALPQDHRAASHHLANTEGPEPLPIVARLVTRQAGNARNWQYTTMLLLRDHYKAAVDEKVGALLLLPDPIWRPSFTVALAWDQRHFGQRLRPETPAAPGHLQSTTPLAQRTRLASCRRRVAATPAPGPSSSPPPTPPPPPPSGSTPPHGLARADAERKDATADARDPASPTPSFSTPTVTLARPTRHPSTGSTGPRLTSSLRNPRLSAN
ncbi:unnamed protein product [Boreogadus saida]